MIWRSSVSPSQPCQCSVEIGKEPPTGDSGDEHVDFGAVAVQKKLVCPVQSGDEIVGVAALLDVVLLGPWLRHFETVPTRLEIEDPVEETRRRVAVEARVPENVAAFPAFEKIGAETPSIVSRPARPSIRSSSRPPCRLSPPRPPMITSSPGAPLRGSGVSSRPRSHRAGGRCPRRRKPCRSLC